MKGRIDDMFRCGATTVKTIVENARGGQNYFGQAVYGLSALFGRALCESYYLVVKIAWFYNKLLYVMRFNYARKIELQMCGLLFEYGVRCW